MIARKFLGVTAGVTLMFTVGCAQQAVAPVSAPVETSKSSVAQPNEFKFSDLKVGMEIAGLKVTSVGPFEAKMGPMAMDNLKVSFEGTKTVSGWYGPSEGFPASFNLDEASRQNFPKLIDDVVSPDWFAFNDLDADVVAKLGKVGKQATIVIKNYTLQRYPAEVSSTADLVEVK